ncbi:MAG: glycosyltransferase [Nitrospirota bacterium]
MNVLVISSKNVSKGSTQYRIMQYAAFLKEHGVSLEFAVRDHLDSAASRGAGKFDAVLNQKCLMRTSLARSILRHSRRAIFDFDDAIYTRPGKPYGALTALRVKTRLHLWLRRADRVTTANQVLARYARQFNDAVTVIPMALDLDLWAPARKSDAAEITIGWTGSPATLPYLERLEPVLTAVLRTYPFVKLAVSSGAKPSLGCPFEYHPYRPGAEPEFVRRLDIGLLPLPDEEYARGKSPIKALQYLACGVPAVGNVIGAAAEILDATNSIAVSSEQDWIGALERLIHDRDLIQSLGQAGRRFVERHHDSRLIREQLLQLLLHANDA